MKGILNEVGYPLRGVEHPKKIEVVKMREINSIIIHCSDSEFGSRSIINDWHIERGFDEIGYHYVILNPYYHSASYTQKQPNKKIDGNIEHGRPIEKIGAHCKGQNTDSIAICLIGKNVFTGRQLFTLVGLVQKLMLSYKLTVDNVFAHYEFNKNKTCPNIDIKHLRKLIQNGG